MNARELAALLPPTDSIEAWLAERSSPGAAEPGAQRRSIAVRDVATPAPPRLLGIGLDAARKLESNSRAANVTREEADGLEALVLLVGRPALRMIDGRFESPPPGWEVLESCRDHLERASLAVGRIELEGHPMYPWAGTGFLIAPDLVMTNRHVVEAFTSRRERGGWTFQPGVSVAMNRAAEPDREPPAVRQVLEIADVHERFDLALLRIEPEEEVSPLRVMTQEIDPSTPRLVVTIGYPAHDSRNDPGVMAEVFGDVYGVKRLQPGKVSVVFPEEGLLRHDCSTLGGNSGSCVVDILSGEVIGLHFRGFYMQYNEAVALPWLKDDALLASVVVRQDRLGGEVFRPRGAERSEV